MLSTWCAAVPVEDLICLDGFRAAATDPHGECDTPTLLEVFTVYNTTINYRSRRTRM